MSFQKKSELRSHVRNFRKMILNEFKISSQEKMATLLADLANELKVESILSYAAMEKQSEIDVSNLKQAFDIPFYLPRVVDKVSFELVLDLGEYHVSAYGIKEPVGLRAEIIPDLIIVPGLAFDQKGNRLGYGAGYYDRYLSQIDDDRCPVKVGVVYNELVFNEIPNESHDIKMNYLVTEKGIVRI